MNRLLRIASRSKLRLTLGVALILALASPLGAFAYFTSTGDGIDSAVAGTLNPPTSVTVPASTTGTVHVAWTASVTGPDAIAPTGYYAERNAGSPGWTPACSSSPSTLLSTTGCDDTVPAAGDYTYRVTALYHSWTTTSGTSSSVHAVTDLTPPTARTSSSVHAVTDLTPPTSTIDLASAGPYNKDGWNAGCATPGTGDICGTANDPGAGATGVAGVQVSIERSSGVGGDYWNGGGWSSAPVWNNAVGTTSWSYPLGTAALDDGVSYTIRSLATDNAGNTQTTSDTQTFRYDATPPTVTVEQPADQPDPTNTLPLRWAVSFSEPVSGLTTAGLNRTGSSSGGTVTLTGSGASYQITLTGTPSDGTVGFSIPANQANDPAGNPNTPSTSTDNTITLDATPPTVTVEQPADQPDPTNTLPLRWAVSFSEPVSGLTTAGLNRTGSSSGGTVTVTGSGASYESTLTGTPSDGTVGFSIPANQANDPAGNPNTPSTSTDNTITLDTTSPATTLAFLQPSSAGTNRWYMFAVPALALIASGALHDRRRRRRDRRRSAH